MIEPLDEFNEAVLRMVADPNLGTDQIGKFRAKSDLDEEFAENSHRLKESIATLKKRGYIKDIKAILMAIGDSSIDYEAYQITALGSNYLAKSNSSSTSFSNISNSNIANHSSKVTQTIDITQQPEDIQKKFAELQDAIEKKDSSAMKKAFGYIADKAVDVAIAIVLGKLIK